MRTLNAFITVFEHEARAQAREADREIAAGRYRGPLHGVPISIKDLFDVRGSATTAASRVRQDHVADADAPSIAALRQAGAVFIGKTNLHEFAFGTTNEDSAYGPARHPLDPNRSPGGSSGGSAASVADGMCYASMGTDTGRLDPHPVGGVRPRRTQAHDRRTHDRWCGAAQHDAGSHRAVLPVGGGRGDSLRRASRRQARVLRRKPIDLRALKLAIPRDYFLSVLDPQVASAFDSACARLRDAGVTLDDVAIPHAGDVAAHLPAHRADRGRRVPCENARTPPGGLHAERADSPPRWDATCWVKTTRARFAGAS